MKEKSEGLLKCPQGDDKGEKLLLLSGYYVVNGERHSSSLKRKEKFCHPRIVYTANLSVINEVK